MYNAKQETLQTEIVILKWHQDVIFSSHYHHNSRAFTKGWSSPFTGVGEFFSSIIVARIKTRFIVGWSRAQKYRECRQRE